MNLISCCLIISCLTQTAVYNTTNDVEEYCKFSSTQKIIETKELKDFNNTCYILYELEHGYALYYVDGNEEVFMEGSYETNSPYYEINDSEMYYLGPGCYFYEENNSVYDILSTDSYKKDDLDGLSPITSESIVSQKDDIKLNGATSENPGKDTSDYPEEYTDYCLIENYFYFQNLSYFPTNYLGTCGVVSLAMLLGYYDTFFNDNFIPNNLSYSCTSYDSNKNPIIISESTNTSQGVKLGYDATCLKNGYYPSKSWGYYPETTQAFHDYIFENCLSYNKILESLFGGYPMTQKNIENTCKNYIEKVSPELLDEISYKCNNINIKNENIFLLLNEVMNYLDNDIPVIVVMLMFDAKGDRFYFGHDAIAYGYNKNGYLLMHLGWAKNGNAFSSTVVNPYLPYGYFAIKYTGEHVHSTNAECPRNRVGTSYCGVCGCGYINKGIFQ